MIMTMIKNHRLLLITTKGCEGCRIAKNILDNVCKLYSDKFDYVIMDREKYLKLPVRESIEDFPTILFYIDNKIFRKVIGTRTKQTFKEYIDEWLETKGVYYYK